MDPLGIGFRGLGFRGFRGLGFMVCVTAPSGFRVSGLKSNVGT